MRPIDADALKEKIDSMWNGRPLSSLGARILVTIDEAPSIDIEPKHGEWIDDKHKNIWGMDVDCYKCSVCGRYAIHRSLIMDTEGLSYCPNCGARMKGADDE